MKIGLFGITGKMGRALAEFIYESPDLTLMGGTTSSSNPLKGTLLHTITIKDHVDSSFLDADIFIDFSILSALPTHLDHAVTYKKPIVVGITGLDSPPHLFFKKAAESIPVLYASNTSRGVSVLSQLLQIAAQKLGDSYDIEICETHHRGKKDSPSGTALMFGQDVSIGRSINFEEAKSIHRKENRQKGEIGFSTMRGGGVFGEHTVRFLGDDEIIELKHTSLNRLLFVKGAIEAACWLKNQKKGFYKMQDVSD